MVALVQTPSRSGCPSAVRGGVHALLAASPWAEAETASAVARTQANTHRSFMGSLGSLDFGFLLARSPENPRHSIVPLMACVFVNRSSRLSHGNRGSPRLGKSRRILHREFVSERIRVRAGESLCQSHVRSGAAEVRLVREIAGLHHQRIAFPVSPRIAQ